MAATLELFDGSTTINFLGTTYRATLPVDFDPPPVATAIAGTFLRGLTYRPRTISFDLTVTGASLSDLRTRIRDLDAMLVRAQERQALAQGTLVVLKVQLGNTDTDDISYRVLMGAHTLPRDLLQEPKLSSGFASVRGRLSLLCEPLGRLASVSVASDTLENEQDGANVNYMDITGIGGVEAALAQIKIVPSSGSGKLWVARRSGSRRTDDLFLQGEEESSIVQGTTPDGAGSDLDFASNGADTTNFAITSAGLVASLAWENNSGGLQSLKTTYTNTGYFAYQIAGGSLPRGLFRVLARVKVDILNNTSNNWQHMAFALGYSFGAASRTPADGDEVRLAADATWEILDLGEINIPPHAIPDGFTAPALELRIYAVWDPGGASVTLGNTEDLVWYIDYLFLLPIDEGAVIVSGLASGDRVLIDSVSDTPGVYVLNASDVVQKFASFVGRPFGLGPEDTRLYALIQHGNSDPSTITLTVTPTYVPRLVGV